MSFRALVLSQGPDRKVSGAIETLDESKLPAGDVTVAIEYSTLNYKDGLVLTSGGGLVKTWPHVGGIDFAGTVETSDNPAFRPGDKVVLNGWRDGEMLVTGAAGGVGSIAVTILARLGFKVVAATGRPQESHYLKSLGATTILDRKELAEAPDRPLLSERFAGVVDTVSGVMLARALAQVKYGGAAAVCGLAGGPSFPGSILPFILRGVTMYGIDSVMLPKAPREEAWRRLGTDLPLDKLDSTVSEVGLSDLMSLAPKILKGEIRGRVVVDVNK